MFTVNEIEPNSYILGSIDSFCEMIMTGCKKIAFSPPINESIFNNIKSLIDEITKNYNCNYYVEKNLISTYLIDDSFFIGKIVLIFYKDNSILEYFSLSKNVLHLEQINHYTHTQKVNITIKLMELLSYSKEYINKKLSII